MRLQRSTQAALAVTVIAALATLFLGVNIYRNKAAAPTAVHILTMQPASLSTQVTATGVTEGLNQVQVKAKIAGTVATLAVAEGADVKAKAVLAEHDPTEVAAQLARAESGAAQAEAQAALTMRRRAADPAKYALDLGTAQRRLADAQRSFDQARDGATDSSAQADRALADAQASFDLLQDQLNTGRVTAADVQRAQAAYDNAKMAFNQNQDSAVYGSSMYMGNFNALTQAQQSLDTLQHTLATQDKAIADQLLQAQHRIDAAKDQLSRLQNGGADRQIAMAQSQLDDAAAALEQLRIQHDLTQTTDADVAAAQAAARAAETAYQQAQADYQQDILSPVDGKVLAVYIKEGDMVAPGTPLFTIGATQDLVIKAKVDEVDIGKVAVGQTAAVTSSAFVGKTFTGIVTRIAPLAVREGNIAVFVAEVTVHNADDLLKPGMNVDVAITSQQKDAVLAVPLEALLDRGNEKVVFVLEGDLARRRTVTTGVTTQTQVEIISGLKAGDQVVTGPADVLTSLKDGDRVKVQP
ncbi:MAG: efflux RND transporter periplasmic adaptor subunit [Symbiobacteriia bacterium]